MKDLIVDYFAVTRYRRVNGKLKLVSWGRYKSRALAEHNKKLWEYTSNHKANVLVLHKL